MTGGCGGHDRRVPANDKERRTVSEVRIAGDGVDRNIRESKGDVFLTSTTGPNCWKKLRTTPVGARRARN